ncbi:hypothetical protein [Nostoc favosum]|nr:hypothetical protein [Nostoc favosum]
MVIQYVADFSDYYFGKSKTFTNQKEIALLHETKKDNPLLGEIVI